MTRLRHLSPFAFFALPLLAAATAASAQTLGQGGGVEMPWWRVVGALAICAGLALAAALLMKKYMRGGAIAFSAPAQRRMQLVDTLRLSHQIDLCVIHYGDKELLVAASAGGATLLSTSERPQDAVQPS